MTQFSLRGMTSRQKKVLSSTTLGFTLDHMDATFLTFALAPMMISLHLNPIQGGLVSAMSNYGALLGGVGIGLLADRFGRVRMLSYTILLVALSTVGLAFTNSAEVVVVLRFLLGVGTGSEYGISTAMIGETFARRDAGKVNSLTAIGGQVGAMLATLLSLMILPLFGWRTLFLIGIVPAFLAVYMRKTLPETDTFEARRAELKAGKKRVSVTHIFNTPQRLLQAGLLVVMLIVQSSGYYGLMAWLPSLLTKQLDNAAQNSHFASLAMIPVIIGMSLGMLFFGTILDKVGPKKIFIIFLLASAGAVYLLALAKSFWLFMLIGPFVGFFTNGVYGGFGALFTLFYPDDIRATASNVLMGIGRGIGGSSSLVIGFLMAWQHNNVAFVLMCLSGTYLVSLVALLFLPGLTSKPLPKASGVTTA